MSEKKMIERYLEMDYSVLVTRDPASKNFVLEVPDWPGCLAHGATIEEAFRKLEDAKYTWVEDCLDRGLAVPLPRPREEYSGKFVLRIARSLHHRLADLAESEGISLNTYVTTVLAEHVGATTGLNLLKAVRDELRNQLTTLGQYAENLTRPVATRTAERYFFSGAGAISILKDPMEPWIACRHATYRTRVKMLDLDQPDLLVTTGEDDVTLPFTSRQK